MLRLAVGVTRSRIMGRNGLVETIRLSITPTANRNSCRVARLVGAVTQGSVLRPQPWAGKSQLLQSCRWVRTVPPHLATCVLLNHSNLRFHPHHHTLTYTYPHLHPHRHTLTYSNTHLHPHHHTLTNANTHLRPHHHPLTYSNTHLHPHHHTLTDSNTHLHPHHHPHADANRRGRLIYPYL